MIEYNIIKYLLFIKYYIFSIFIKKRKFSYKMNESFEIFLILFDEAPWMLRAKNQIKYRKNKICFMIRVLNIFQSK